VISLNSEADWLVEAADPQDSDLDATSLSCISDDAQGEHLAVLWDAEISPQSLDDNCWQNLGQGAPDAAEVLAAHIRVVLGIRRPQVTATSCRRRSGRASGSTPISCFRCERRSASPV
jgi:hypothetical protein